MKKSNENNSENVNTSIFYIWNTKTDETYDPNEHRFYPASWEIELEEKGYLESLMHDNPEKFENCIIADQGIL